MNNGPNNKKTGNKKTSPNANIKNALSKINVLKKAINNVSNAELETNTSVRKYISFNGIKNKINLKMVIIGIVALIVLLLAGYIIISFVHYNNKSCFEKKSFFHYLLDRTEDDPCILENEPGAEMETGTGTGAGTHLLPAPEVFHISNQIFKYEDSKCKCASYDSRLAKKSEIIDAYNAGASWGNSYGWAEDNSAYFVVQKCDYDKCMEENERLPEHKRKFCGKPGINGGKFPNEELKFGALCYGFKPKGKVSKEKEATCPPMNYCKLDKNHDVSTQMDSDVIVPFNADKWSA